MPNLSLKKTSDLAFKARQGDLKAGKELIHKCRQGMVVPEWENPPKLTKEIVEAHLKRRVSKGSGRMFG